MTIETVLEKLRRRWTEVILIFFMTIVYGFSYFQGIAVPGTIFNQFQLEFALSSSGVALLAGIYLYTRGGMQLPGALAIDRFGGIKVVTIAGTLLTIGAIVFPLSHSVTLLYIARGLMGLSASVMYLALVKEIDARVDERHFLTVLGVASSFGMFVSLLGTFPFERAASILGWRESLVMVGIIIGVAVLGVVYFGKKAPRVIWSRTVTNPGLALKRVFLNKMSYPVIGACLAIFSTTYLLRPILGKKLLEDCFNLSPSTAALFVFISMILTGVSTGFTSFVPVLLGHRRKPFLVGIGCANVLATAGMIASMSYGRNPSWAFACYMLLGISAGSIWMFSCTIREVNWADSAATSVGVMVTIAYIGSGMVATLAGKILDLFRAHAIVMEKGIRYPVEAYRIILIGLFLLSIVSIVFALFIKETKGANIWKNHHGESSGRSASG